MLSLDEKQQEELNTVFIQSKNATENYKKLKENITKQNMEIINKNEETNINIKHLKKELESLRGNVENVQFATNSKISEIDNEIKTISSNIQIIQKKSLNESKEEAESFPTTEN